ncbi:MAG: AAA family ATPase [Bacteroides sp.]
MYNFHSLGIDTQGRTSGRLKTICPKCHEQRRDKRDKSLSINLDLGMGKCHYCGWTFHLDDDSDRLRRESGNFHHFESVPQHFRRPVFEAGRTQLSDRLTRWFVNQRCIPQQVLEDLLITEQLELLPQTGQRQNCACFNYFEKGELVNVKYRDGAKNFKMVAGAELIPYNVDGIYNTPEAIITEGEIDALSYMALGRRDVISVPAGANANLTWLDRFVETHFDSKKVIYLATDTDRKGLVLRAELLRRLGSDRCRIVSYGAGCKDANEHLVRYGLESLRITLEQAEEIPLEGVFTAADVATDLRTLYENGFGRGADTGLENLDKLCTFELQRLLILSGVPGDGKSEFTDELVLRLCLRHDWRVAFFSPENVPVVYHLCKLAEKLTARRFHSGCGMTDQLYQRVTRYLTDHICHILPEKEDFSLDTVLEKGRELVARRGIRILVIDPLNRLESGQTAGMTETQYLSQVLNRLSAFAVHNGCLVVLVAHPRKMNRNPLTNKRAVAEMYDINGSAEFFNKADFGLIIERDREAGVVRVHVEKVKFKQLGQPGVASFVYDTVSGRYYPCEENTDPHTPPDKRVCRTQFDADCWLPKEEEEDKEGEDLFGATTV